jgi:acyl carrier protein
MRDQIGRFVIESLHEMNYDIDGVDDDTMLGPAGVDLESLALAELAVRMEDRYGVKFEEDELERVAAMTIGEFGGYVAASLTAS